MKFFRKLTFRALRDSSGAAAVEFSLILFPFILLIFGGIGLGLSYWTNVMFDSNLDIVAKQVYEEQALCADANANFPYNQACLANRICEAGSLVVVSQATCKSTIRVDIRTFRLDGTDPVLPDMVNGSGINSAAFSQQMGVGRNVVVMIRAAMPAPNWAFFSPVDGGISKTTNLVASQAFRVRRQETYNAVN